MLLFLRQFATCSDQPFDVTKGKAEATSIDSEQQRLKDDLERLKLGDDDCDDWEDLF